MENFNILNITFRDIVKLIRVKESLNNFIISELSITP